MASHRTPNSPIAVLSLITFALVASALPAVTQLLVYDRQAIVAGQWWRLVTGHLVHFSSRHLLFDALVFGITGWLIEKRSRRQLMVLCRWSALLIGLTVFTLLPGIRYYGGLSGIACAMLTYLALVSASEDYQRRWLFAAVLLMLAGKISWECATGRTLFAATDGFVVLPLSHAVGAMSAVSLWGRHQSRQACRSRKEATS